MQRNCSYGVRRHQPSASRSTEACSTSTWCSEHRLIFDPGFRQKGAFKKVNRPLTIDSSPGLRRRSRVVASAIKDNSGCSHRQQSNNRLLLIRKYSFSERFSRAGVKKSIGKWASRLRQPTAQTMADKRVYIIKSIS